MRIATEEATKSSELLKCGVVIAKDGKVIACTFNSQRQDNDATAHAEIKAIRETGQKLGNKNLAGCIVYGTCEPCTMCLSAMIFAKISKLVYSQDLSDVSQNRINISLEELLEKSPNKIAVEKLKQ